MFKFGTEMKCMGDGSSIRASKLDLLLRLTVTVLKQTKKNASLSASVHRLVKKFSEFRNRINSRKDRIEEIANLVSRFIRNAWLTASTITLPAASHSSLQKDLDCFSVEARAATKLRVLVPP